MSLHYYLTIPHLDRPSSKLARYSTYSTNTSERENKTSFERWQWVLPRPKAAFLQELCFEDTVRLRPPQKKNNLINDIDIFCCIQKNPSFWCLSPGSPDPGPNLRRRSSQYSLQGAGPALLLRPCWYSLVMYSCLYFCSLYFYFVFFFLVLVFILFIF